MAKISTNVALDMLNLVDSFTFYEVASADIISASKTKISLYDTNGNKQIYTGRFAVDYYGDLDYSNSSLTGLTQYVGSAKAFDASGFYIRGSDYQAFWDNQDALGIIGAVLAGNDVVTGSKFDDTLRGGRGSNRLNGGKGDDILYSNIRSNLVFDELTGGAGADTFFAAFCGNGEIVDELYDPITGIGKVIIKDFKASQGDKISLGFYDSDWINIDLSYDGAVFSGEAGSVIFQAGNKFGQLLVDTDGNSSADVFVQVYGAKNSFDSSWLTLNPSQPV